jgi:hypothetical protein
MLAVVNDPDQSQIHNLSDPLSSTLGVRGGGEPPPDVVDSLVDMSSGPKGIRQRSRDETILTLRQGAPERKCRLSYGRNE